ncbi:MAG: steroid 3-ketoacyl-CoA thiolase, partial [Chloroflexota bacterium]
VGTCRQDLAHKGADRLIPGLVGIDPTGVDLGLFDRFLHVGHDAFNERFVRLGSQELCALPGVGPGAEQRLVQQVLLVAVRRDTTLEALAALPPAQSWEPETAPDITAGNSSQMTDGAAAMIIAARATAERLGLPVRARFVHFAVGADDAVLVLSAPNRVTRELFERTGLGVDDFDAIECNEAFAAIALMWAREFKPDMERYNPRGGAIAIGTPPAELSVPAGATLPATLPRGAPRS